MTIISNIETIICMIDIADIVFSYSSFLNEDFATNVKSRFTAVIKSVE